MTSIRLRRSLVFSIVCLALVGCTKKEESASVSIRFPGPPAESRSAALQSVSPFTTSDSWDPVDPTSLSELGCFAVFVGGPETELRGSVCKNKAGSEIIRFGRVAGLFGRGQTVTLEIPPGKSRQIVIAGMKLVNGVCQAPVSGLTLANYSNPYLIGQTTVDLQPGIQDVEINAVNSFTNDNKIGDCTFLPGSGGDGGGGGGAIQLAVAPLYTNGVNWNDYVQNQGPSAYGAPACSGSETGGPKACVHGGEKRKVTVTGQSSCSGLTADDNLGVFQWKCQVVGGVATFISSGFQSHKGLADLLDPTSFKPNFVIVKQSGTVIAQSSPDMWWHNTVKSATSNASTASAPVSLALGAGETNTIFTVSGGNVTSSGYNLGSDKTALVVLPGSKLQYSGRSAASCDTANASLNTVSGNRCVVAASGKKFQWIEGAIEAAGGTKSDFAVFLYGASFSRLHRVTANLHVMDGIRLQASQGNTLTEIATAQNTLSGIYLTDSSYNLLTDISTSSNSSHGLRLEDTSASTYCNHNVLRRIVSANNGGQGFLIHQGDFNIVESVKSYNNTGKGVDIGGNNQVLSQIVSFGNANAGLNLWGSRSTANFVTVVHNKQNGIALTTQNAETGYFAVNQYLSVSNGWYDGTNPAFNLHILNHANSHLSQGFLSNGSGTPSANIRLQTSSAIKFSGLLMIESGVGCDILSSTGLDLDASCNAANGSLVNVISVTSPASVLVGKVTSSDIANTSGDGTGQGAYHPLMDWFHFQSPLFRLWGSTGSPDTTTSDRGPCTSGNCQIWDIRLKSASSLLRNKSGNGTSNNETFVAGAACPSAVQGDRYRDDMLQLPYSSSLVAVRDSATGAACASGDTTCFNRFLMNAIEIMDDDVGDDDGLCESNERCIYAPNIGAYQGDGDLVGPCVFQDSSTYGVKGVQMYAYPNNGI